ATPLGKAIAPLVPALATALPQTRWFDGWRIEGRGDFTKCGRHLWRWRGFNHHDLARSKLSRLDRPCSLDGDVGINLGFHAANHSLLLSGATITWRMSWTGEEKSRWRATGSCLMRAEVLFRSLRGIQIGRGIFAKS